MNNSYKLWIVISYRYNPTTHTLFGPYVDLYNSEEEADERLEDFRDKPDWVARKEYQVVKIKSEE